jgi:dihydropteroate synthase
MSPAQFESWLREQQRRPLVMGVLNVTPDSFSDGGRFADPTAAAEAAVQMIGAGADWVDVGGESTRPGALPVDPPEQIRRVVPVIAQIRRQSDTLLSVDTTSAAVAEAALDAGADVVNDISAGRGDPRMLAMLAERSASIILLHMRGTPATMQLDPTYKDVTEEVCGFLAGRRAAAIDAGLPPHRILLDPGLGFGKKLSHNLALIRDTAALARLGAPLVVGPSRKSFIGQITGEPRTTERVFGTAAAVAWCVANGAAVVRVHDVGPIAQVVRMICAISAGNGPDFLKNNGPYAGLTV